MLRDPNFQPAYLQLAFSYFQQWVFQLSRDPQIPVHAVEAAQRTIAINDSIALAYATLGCIYLRQRQHEQAIAEGKRAIALDPKGVEGYTLLAVTLGCAGRLEEAVQRAEQALHRKPSVPDSHLASVGAAYYLAGRRQPFPL